MANWPTLIKAMAPLCEYLSPANEPVAASVPDYMALLKLTHDAAKAANPNVKIIGPSYYEGITGRFVDKLATLIGTSGFFDLIDLFEYHCYAGAPEAVLNEMIQIQAKVAAAASKVGKSAPEICLTETGWTTGTGVPSTVDLAQLVDYYSFAPLLFRTMPGVRAVTYYTLHDESTSVYSGMYGVYQGGSAWAEKAAGLLGVLRTALAEARAATAAKSFNVNGVWYVWYTAPDQRLAIRSPAGAKTVTVNTGAGPVQVQVGTRTVFLKGSTYPDFSGAAPVDKDQIIMSLQAQLQTIQQQLADAQAQIVALQADASATDQALAKAQADLSQAQAKISAAKAALA
jgi:hypothetical protein